MRRHGGPYPPPAASGERLKRWRLVNAAVQIRKTCKIACKQSPIPSAERAGALVR
ncbi:hypothetical protein HMPREF0185_03210 [Brevundimonas diminuta 470-4]|nr:hypothetical protein HMPREF0185_03210 [Brevundimonas diminuta 470-4]